MESDKLYCMYGLRPHVRLQLTNDSSELDTTLRLIGISSLLCFNELRTQLDSYDPSFVDAKGINTIKLDEICQGISNILKELQTLIDVYMDEKDPHSHHQTFMRRFLDCVKNDICNTIADKTIAWANGAWGQLWEKYQGVAAVLDDAMAKADYRAAYDATKSEHARVVNRSWGAHGRH